MTTKGNFSMISIRPISISYALLDRLTRNPEYEINEWIDKCKFHRDGKS